MENLEQKSKSIDMVEGLDQMQLTATMDAIDQFTVKNETNLRNDDLVDKEPRGLETGREISEYFYGIEIADFDTSTEYGTYIGTKVDLYVSSIAKQGDTLILNNGAIELTSKNGNVSYKLRKGNHTITIGWVDMGVSNRDTWRKIYNTLNAKYFS